MKRLFAVLLISVFVFSLAACGESGSSSSGDQTASTSAEKEEAAAIKAETYDVGEFTVDVPENFFVSIQQDMFGEKDADGNYPTREDAIALIKDGENDWDAFDKPTLYIYYHDDQSAEDVEEVTKWVYEDCEDIDVTVNGTKCVAFTGNLGTGEEGKAYVYDFVFIPTGDASCFQINIPVDMIDFKGFNIDDADLVAIMNSLKVK